MKSRALLLLLAVAPSFVGVDVARGQTVSPKGTAEALQPIAVRLIQASQDLLDITKRTSTECETAAAYNDMSSAMFAATADIQEAQALLRMFSFVPEKAPTRANAAMFLRSQIAVHRQQLELDARKLTLALTNAQVAADAALVATRARDDIRAALEVLQNTSALK